MSDFRAKLVLFCVLLLLSHTVSSGKNGPFIEHSSGTSEQTPSDRARFKAEALIHDDVANAAVKKFRSASDTNRKQNTQNQGSMQTCVLIPRTDEQFNAMYGRNAVGSELAQAQGMANQFVTEGATISPADSGRLYLRDFIKAATRGGVAIIVGHSARPGQLALLDGSEISIDEIHEIALEAGVEAIVVTCYSPDFGLREPLDLRDAYAMWTEAGAFMSRAKPKANDLLPDYTRFWKDRDGKRGKHIVISCSQFVTLGDDEEWQVVFDFRRRKPFSLDALLLGMGFISLGVGVVSLESTAGDRWPKNKQDIKQSMLEYLHQSRRLRTFGVCIIVGFAVSMVLEEEWGYRTFGGMPHIVYTVAISVVCLPLLCAGMLWWKYPSRSVLLRCIRGGQALWLVPAYIPCALFRLFGLRAIPIAWRVGKDLSGVLLFLCLTGAFLWFAYSGMRMLIPEIWASTGPYFWLGVLVLLPAMALCAVLVLGLLGGLVAVSAAPLFSPTRMLFESVWMDASDYRSPWKSVCAALVSSITRYGHVIGTNFIQKSKHI